MTSTEKHCAGYEQVKHLQAFTCKCQNCGEEKEIFSDELERQHMCKKCGQEIDFKKCRLEGGV